MNLRDTLWLGLKGIAQRKGRTVLTVLTVAIGVAAIVALVSLVAGISASISSELSSVGPTTLFLTPRQGAFTVADVAEISSFPNVSTVIPLIQFTANATVGSNSTRVTVIGVSSADLANAIGTINLYSGSVYNEVKDQSKKTEETNNYEISHTTKTEVTEAGRVNQISVAVLVDGSYAKNEKGEMVYQERSKEQLERIATLVRSAIGFDQKRGDQVEVVNLKFAEAPAIVPIAEPSGLLGMLQFTKDDVMYVIELGVMMLLSLVVLFMVIRPLVRRILASEVVPALADGAAPALTDGSAAAGAAGQSLVPGTPSLIDVAQVQGQVHAQSVHRVGELAERNPNETAAIIRQWLTEPA